MGTIDSAVGVSAFLQAATAAAKSLAGGMPRLRVLFLGKPLDDQTSHSTRSSWHCTSGEFLEAAARCPDFLLVTASLLKSPRAAERKRDDVARARRRWIREQGLLDPARLVCIDETAVTTNMVRPNGWSPRGERLIGEVSMGHGEALTFIAGFRKTRIVATMLIKGAIR